MHMGWHMGGACKNMMASCLQVQQYIAEQTILAMELAQPMSMLVRAIQFGKQPHVPYVRLMSKQPCT